MSRLFICALVGLGLTAIGLTDIVDWPLWPASLALEYGFGIRDPFEDRTTQERIPILVALIATNSMFWGLLAYGGIELFRKRRAGTDDR